MFFCKECKIKNKWPAYMPPSSLGLCEVCNKHTTCYDIPSSHLPIPGKTMEETRQIDKEIEEYCKKIEEKE